MPKESGNHRHTMSFAASSTKVGCGPFPAHWLEDFTFLTMSLEKMPWRNWKGLES